MADHLRVICYPVLNLIFSFEKYRINYSCDDYILTSIFTRLTPGKLKEFCRSHADLSYSFSVYYSELRSSPVFSKRSSVIISKAPDYHFSPAFSNVTLREEWPIGHWPRIF